MCVEELQGVNKLDFGKFKLVSVVLNAVSVAILWTEDSEKHLPLFFLI